MPTRLQEQTRERKSACSAQNDRFEVLREGAGGASPAPTVERGDALKRACNGSKMRARHAVPLQRQSATGKKRRQPPHSQNEEGRSGAAPLQRPDAALTLRSSGIGTDRTISDVLVISIARLILIGDFQSKGNSRFVPRHRPPGTRHSRHRPPAPRVTAGNRLPVES